jgi:predicted lipid-binding transport protein (Tim44 family)
MIRVVHVDLDHAVVYVRAVDAPSAGHMAYAALPARGGGGQGGGGSDGGGGGSFSGGGGGGFSGGGFSGGSSSGAATGSGGIGGFLIVMLVIIAFVVINNMAKRRGHLDGGSNDMAGKTYASQVPTGHLPDPEAATAAIRDRDPGFTLEGFYADVNRIFFIVQHAWMNLDAGSARAVMADGIWQQWNVQLQTYRSVGKRNVLEDLALLDIDAIRSEYSATLQAVTVRIRAACADYDVDSAGTIIRGDRVVRQWWEDWTFQRDVGTRTGVTSAPKSCPNCGAPYEGDLSGTCAYCDVPIIGGATGWALARIDQVR